MDEIVEALGEQHAELAAQLAPLADADWARATPCEGWSIADVVLHLSQTDELAIASVQGRFAETVAAFAEGIAPGVEGTIDEGADLMVARERGAAGAATRERWRRGADDLRAVLADSDPHRRVTWVAGALSTRTLATTRLAECWIHTGDVAAALGMTLVPTDRLEHVARLAWRTIPYAFARGGRELTGPVAFELEAPSGAAWAFVPDVPPLTVIRGDAVELCLVAARRREPEDTALRVDGPDGPAVLELVRTYA